MFQKLVQQFLRRFFQTMGREPQTRAEWMQIQDQAVRHLNKTKGAPSITKNIPGEVKITIDDVLKGPVESGGPKGPRSWDLSQKKGEVVPFPEKGIRGLMEKGDVQLGTAPKTLKSTLKAKKDRGILLSEADEGVARIKRENKQAIEDFKKKHDKAEKKREWWEDIPDEEKGPWDIPEKPWWDEPDKFQFGGIAPLVGEPTYAADFYDDRIPMKEGKKTKKKKKKLIPKKDAPFQGPEYETDIPKEAAKEILSRYLRSGIVGAPLPGGFSLDMPYGTNKEFDIGIGYGTDPGSSDFSVGYGVNLDGEDIMGASYQGDNWDIGVKKREGSDPTFGLTWKKRFDQGGIARIGLAGGGALFKFIEKLFIKASNDIRLGKGKWKGLDQKQRGVQHDNLIKKVTEFQKTGKTVGMEEYFGVDPHTAFIAARDKAKRLGIKKDFKKQEVQAQADKMEAEMWDEGRDAVDSLTGEKELTKRIKIGQKGAVEEKIKRERTTDDLVKEAYDEIAGGSGFSGDYKYDADILADSIAEVQGKVYADLPNLERSGIYDLAYKRVVRDLKTKMDFKKNLKDVEQKIELQMFDPKDRKPNAEGGRADFIFGGSAGLKAMWKQMMKGLSKKRGEPITKLFPKLSADERRMEKLVMGTPEQKAFREGEVEHKLEGIDLLINRLKHDKKILERQAKSKAMKDEGLDFLMKQIEQDMPDVYGPHLKKYTDIDKDILQMENIKKNLIMKDRKLNAYGGRIGYAGGGKTGLPAVTMGTPQMNMQQPQMPAGPQPAGIPGGTIVAQNQMQQSPWMGSQMQQGVGGMPGPGGMPKPGGMNPMMGGQPRAQMAGGGMGRRAFLKLMAGLAALPLVGTGVTRVAPKAIKAIETIKATDAAGMPAWFPTLVERVIKEGDDISKGAARIERETVHTLKLPESGTELTVYNDLIKGNVKMEVGFGKHGNVHGKFGQPYSVHLKKGDEIEEGIMRGKKEPDEFVIEEAEFTGGHPENVKFEESAFEKFGDEVSDLAEIEAFAKKTTTKKLHKAKKTKPKDVEGPQADWDDSLPDDPDDFYGDYASGGLAAMLGE